MNRSEQLDTIIKRLVLASDPVEIRGIYAEWAATYEQDLDYFGYLAPKLAVEMVHQALPTLSAEILDAGCGTGLVGQALAAKGYTTIDGCDFSAEMRTKAADTGHYRTLRHADFMQPIIPFADASYEAVLCIGVYSSRLHPQFLSELIRLAKPNGIVALTCRPHYFESDVAQQLQRFESEGVIAIETLTHQRYMQGQAADAAYIVVRKQVHH